MATVPVISKVVPLDRYMLEVTFANGESRRFDVAPYIDKFKAFKPILSEALFRKVHIDAGGYAIAWDDDIDIDRYDIW